MFDQYLVYSGEHPIAKELREAEERTGKTFSSLLGRDATHYIYKFPNGYGASVVHGLELLYPGQYEVAALEYEGDFESEYRLVGEPVRNLSKAGVFRELSEIFKYGSIQANGQG